MSNATISPIGRLRAAASSAVIEFNADKKRLSDLRSEFWYRLDRFAEIVDDETSTREAIIGEFKQAYRAWGAPGDFGYGTPQGDALKELYDAYSAYLKSQATHRIGCPDCGPVDVIPDIFDSGRPTSGDCPKCEMRLYFA